MSIILQFVAILSIIALVEWLLPYKLLVYSAGRYNVINFNSSLWISPFRWVVIVKMASAIGAASSVFFRILVPSDWVGFSVLVVSLFVWGGSLSLGLFVQSKNNLGPPRKR